MAVDPEVKKRLDARLASGDISEADYERLLSRLTSDPGARSVSPSPRYDVTRDGFAVVQVADGQVLRGKYQVEQQLGRGGMGVVYRAQDQMLKTTVALKILPVEIAQQGEAVERLREEALLTMGLHHEHIMAVHGFEHEGSLAFIVMEYISGPSLSQLLIRAKGPLAADDVLRWGIEACDALAYAHKKNVWHRDIKPGNLMVDGPDRVLKLCDFGLATQLRLTMTQVTGRQLSGTPLYMAPEQFRGEKPDRRSDLYALAMTLYECLLGEHPWLHAADLSRLAVSKLPDAIPGLPDEVNHALQRGLAKDRKDRFANATEFKEALELARKAMAGRPVVKPTETTLDLSALGEAATPPEPVTPKPKTTSQVNLPKIEPAAPVARRWTWAYITAAALVLLVGLFAVWQPWSSPVTPKQPKPPDQESPPPTAPTPAPKLALELVSIPGGSFFMGCNDKLDRNCQPNEKPGEETSVGAFAIQRTEVTVADYRACVNAGKCDAATVAGKKCNWGRSGKDDHPMNCVSLAQAKAFCGWADARLPTGKEWERAARGTDGRLYPWGNGKPTCALAVMDGCGAKETQAVGAKPSGASPEGLQDMAGNVYEWTKEGEARGGGYSSDAAKLRTSRRLSVGVATADGDLGFRCAK
jgi:serine/threonine protein kinase